MAESYKSPNLCPTAENQPTFSQARCGHNARLSIPMEAMLLHKDGNAHSLITFSDSLSSFVNWYDCVHALQCLHTDRCLGMKEKKKKKHLYVKMTKCWGIHTTETLIFKAKHFPFINPAGLFSTCSTSGKNSKSLTCQIFCQSLSKLKFLRNTQCVLLLRKHSGNVLQLITLQIVVFFLSLTYQISFCPYVYILRYKSR